MAAFLIEQVLLLCVIAHWNSLLMGHLTVELTWLSSCSGKWSLLLRPVHHHWQCSGGANSEAEVPGGDPGWWTVVLCKHCSRSSLVDSSLKTSAGYVQCAHQTCMSLFKRDFNSTSWSQSHIYVSVTTTVLLSIWSVFYYRFSSLDDHSKCFTLCHSPIYTHIHRMHLCAAHSLRGFNILPKDYFGMESRWGRLVRGRWLHHIHPYVRQNIIFISLSTQDKSDCPKVQRRWRNEGGGTIRRMKCPLCQVGWSRWTQDAEF